MRFEKIRKHSLSSVTTKGWSGKSHHPRKSETSVDFVGVDGEGVTYRGGHRYVLFGIGEDQIEDESGLNWKDVFTFLYSKYKPRTAFVGFYLGYDFTQIFRTLPEQRAWMLLTTEGQKLRRHRIPGKVPHPVQYDGWQFDTLASKRLRIRPKDCDCEVATCGCRFRPWMYVCDAGSFFQTSLLRVLDPDEWAEGTELVSREEFADIKTGKSRRSTAILDDDMRRYNRLENVALSRVMRTLDRGFHQIGIHLTASKWFGPGQAAQEWLKNEKVPTREELAAVVPPWFFEAARMSYFGGWFEQFIHGIIPGESHEYDINSAYPSIIRRLPCLLHGRYKRGRGLPDAGPSDLCLVYARVWSPGMPNPSRRQHIGTMLHRDRDGQIFRPLATEGWYWWDELQAAQRAGLVKRLDNRGHQKILQWVKYTPCDCPPPMAGIDALYQRRLDVGKKTPLGKGSKLVYNSDYGKFAQSVGDPIFGNPIYASRITAGCRIQILDAISGHPLGMAGVSMVATDAVYFLTMHPGLTISERLGEWDYQTKRNLTLFKPGVYWDDQTREDIANKRSPHFKARGFKAADFANALARVDSEFAAWPATGVFEGSPPEGWPSVSFKANFAMVTALQALRRGDWSQAGHVSTNTVLEQNADPSQKRQGLWADTVDGRRVYRSNPRFNMSYYGGEGSWIPSEPYEKRFGIDDPFSEEYRQQMGITKDGDVASILAWILSGE